MNLLGIRLRILMGPTPTAAPLQSVLIDALRDIEVTHSDRDVSGFRMSFETGRANPVEMIDDLLVSNPQLNVNSRVILSVFFDITPTVIMDGIVTKRDYIPGDKPGEGKLVLTGKDLSVVLDKEVKKEGHPSQIENTIVTKVADSYPEYGLTTKAIPPSYIKYPIPVDFTPWQNSTDWIYLNLMAIHHGYVTFIETGLLPGTNTLYWGPPDIVGFNRKALSMNVGPDSNVSNLNFGQDALATTLVSGSVKDKITGKNVPIKALFPTRTPLGLVPETLSHAGNQRTVSMSTGGLDIAEAVGRYQAALNRSSDDTITVSGTVNSLKYNRVLKARNIVDLRGAGFSYNGSYVVRSVTHNISNGNYSQDFTLSRNEMGTKTAYVSNR